MKILSIVWYKVLPPKFGGQKGIANFNKYIAKCYPLVCICSKNNEAEDGIPYKVLPQLPLSKWQFFNPWCWKKIKNIAKKEEITHIILEHPYHGIAAVKTKKSIGATLILHSHNIESERYRQTGRRFWRLIRYYEKWVCKKADFILFKTEADKNFAIKSYKVEKDKCIVLPYCIEQTAPPDKIIAKQLICQRHGILPTEKILLFTGTLDYLPNAKAAEKIYSKIAPGLSADKYLFKVIICGRNKFASFQYLKSLTHPNVILAGEVNDIENYFAAADVFINPVQAGGGVQTKNIDALAHNCNLVCFENMIEKETIALATDKIFAIAPGDWQMFIQEIKKAASQTSVTNPAFFKYYNWETTINGLVNKINKI